MGLLRIAKKGADELVELADNLLNAKKADEIVIPERPEGLPFYKRDMTPEQISEYDDWRKRYRAAKEAEKRRSRTPDEVEAVKKQRKGFYEANKERLIAEKKIYYQDNREEILEKQREHLQENSEEINARRAVFRENNRDVLKQRSAEWRANNPEKAREVDARNKANRMQRVPAWESDRDRRNISEIYDTRSLISEITGIPHHVDHVIPLQGKYVSGLHTPDNLLIVPGSENVRKYNRFTPGDLPPRAGIRQARRLLKQLEAARKGR